MTAELVGREDVLERFGRALALLSEGVGSVVLLEGAAGAGKSRLIEHARSLAEAGGAPVIGGTGSEFGGGAPLELFRHAMPSAAPADPGPDALRAPDVDRSRSVDRFLGFAESSAPCLIWGDDLQWADDHTLLALAATCARLDQLPIMLVLARRPQPRPTAMNTLLDACDAHAGRLQVTGLSPDAVTALATSVLGGTPPPSLMRVLSRAAGNPFLVLQLLETLLGTSQLRRHGDSWTLEDVETPPEVLEIVSTRLRRLPDDVYDLLRFASAFGRQIDAAILAKGTGLPLLEVMSHLERATSEALLDPVDDTLEFGHDLLREALYSSMPTTVRQAVHRDLAEAMADSARPVIEIADQHLRGGPPFDDRAILRLCEASRAALSHSPTLSMTMLEAVVDSMDAADPRRVELIADLGRAMFWAGRTGDAEALVDSELVALEPGPSRLKLRTLQAEILFIVGRLRQAASAFEALAREPGVESAGLRWAEAGVCQLLAGELDVAEPLLWRGHQRADADGDSRGTVEALGGLSWLAALRGDAARAVAIAEAAVNRADADATDGHRAIPYLFLGQALNWADRSDEALEAYAAGRAAYDRLGVGWHEPLYAAAISGELVRSGQWDDAVAEAHSVLRYSRDTNSAMTDAWAYATLAEIARRRGDATASRRWLDDAGELFARGASQGMDLVMWQEALLLDHVGRTKDAAALIHALWDHLWRHGVVARAREFALDACWLALRTEDRATAWDVAEAAASMARGTGDATFVATMHLCHGLVENEPEELLAAYAILEERPRPLERARCAEELAVSHASRGRTGTARSWVERATREYHAVSADADLERVRSRCAMHDLVVRPNRVARPATGWGSLTVTEKMVAELVAEGLSNADVAAHLGVSRRTVESHLYRIYPKLGVNNRLQLMLSRSERR